MRTTQSRIWLTLLSLTLGAVPVVSATSQSPSVGSANCGPEIPGLANVLKHTRFLVFGEIHGTAEIPAFFAGAVCHAARSGGKTIVALEIPTAEQTRLDAYMKANGGDLASGPFWANEYQDGRASRAMLNLIERLREMKGAGLQVEIVAFDPALASEERDAYLAATLSKSRKANPAARFMVLTGNLHARRGARKDGDSVHRFMANRLADDEPSLVTLNILYPGGAAWICTGVEPQSCGERKLGSRNKDAGLQAGIAFTACEAAAPYCGTFSVGEIHASLPAFRRP